MQTLFYYHLYFCLCSTAKVCLETPEVALATTNITSRFYQKEATIECQVGYEFPDGDEFKTIICDVSNTGVNWTDPGYDTCQCKCIEGVEWSVIKWKERGCHDVVLPYLVTLSHRRHAVIGHGLCVKLPSHFSHNQPSAYTNYSWPGVINRQSNFDSVAYKHHWEYPINKNTPWLTCTFENLSSYMMIWLIRNPFQQPISTDGS